MQRGEGMWVCIGVILDILHLESIRTFTVNLQKLQDVKTLRDKNKIQIVGGR
jgi:hypothetical protein